MLCEIGRMVEDLIPPNCPVCLDARWVCEAHPDRPWGIPEGCSCGAPGMPCSACNPSDREHPPQMPEGYQSFIRKSDADIRAYMASPKANKDAEHYKTHVAEHGPEPSAKDLEEIPEFNGGRPEDFRPVKRSTTKFH
jgi:hypothetical protein